MNDRIELIIKYHIEKDFIMTEFISEMYDVPTAGSLINRFYPLEVLMEEKRPENSKAN